MDFSIVSIFPNTTLEIVSGFILLFFGFVLGYLFQAKKSQVKSLIREAKMRAGQIKALEDDNKDMEATMRRLSAKEFELSNANQRLRELEDAKSKFVSVSTHQLRTPLAAIKWTFHMFLNNQLGEISAEQKEFLQKGFDSTERMIKIVNELLAIDLSSASPDDVYQFGAVELESLIKNILAEFYSPAQSKDINFVFDSPPSDLPPVRADLAKLKIVLENLIDNAVKYSARGGQIMIGIDDRDVNSSQPKVKISIKDKGIGLSSEAKKKIFQKFYRAPEAVSLEPDGSGLGLSIAKDIIGKHGGTIWFESEAGSGAVFHFTLPLFQK